MLTNNQLNGHAPVTFYPDRKSRTDAGPAMTGQIHEVYQGDRQGVEADVEVRNGAGLLVRAWRGWVFASDQPNDENFKGREAAEKLERMRAAAPELVEAGAGVLAAWESGDLAAAVRRLAAALEKAGVSV